MKGTKTQINEENSEFSKKHHIYRIINVIKTNFDTPHKSVQTDYPISVPLRQYAWFYRQKELILHRVWLYLAKRYMCVSQPSTLRRIERVRSPGWSCGTCDADDGSFPVNPANSYFQSATMKMHWKPLIVLALLAWYFLPWQWDRKTGGLCSSGGLPKNLHIWNLYSPSIYIKCTRNK